MPIHELTKKKITPLEETTFEDIGYKERKDLQRLLRNQINVISPDTLMIAEEFKNWEGSSRAIDLLGIDKDANLVVIELKRTQDGGHMDLQAIRYAAMISTMTFDKAVAAFRKYLKDDGKDDIDPEIELLNFLDWNEPDDTEFGQDVKIVLASAEFSREITTTVLWLNDQDIDVRCVRLQPYKLGDRILIDAQKIVPLPEVEKYQIQVREKTQKEREARTSRTDHTRFDLYIGGNKINESPLPKNRTIHHICKYLCDKGIKPEEIASICERYIPRKVWCSVEGKVNSDDFFRLAKQDNEKFDSSRYHCNADQLVHADGRTYALTNQWGGNFWYNAMDALQEEHPDYKIEFSEAT